MKRLLLGVLMACGLYFPQILNGQVLYSNGAVISMSLGAVVQVNGGFELAQISTLTNHGTVTISKNSTFPIPGTFRIGANSVVSGNGSYFVEQDWVNDGAFNAGGSTVTLFGNTQQFITSNNGIATAFNNLTLTGIGTGINRRKTLQGVSASTSATGVLAINGAELSTLTNTFYVINPSVSAVTYTTTFGSEGFVSSMEPGVFSRLTNSTGTYIFPTGSSLGSTRFRPIELTPQTNEASQYVARFNNFDASSQAFDRTQTDDKACALNPTYFHSIDRLIGSAPTDVRLFYIISDDGDWSGIAHWRNASSNWNDMGTTSAAVNGGFTTRTHGAWNFSNPGHPYILSTIRPEAPVLNCPAVCANSVDNLFTLTGTTGNYQWTFPSNATLQSGQGTDNVLVDWGTGVNEVSAIAIGQNGCNSLPGTCTPIIAPNPTVDFSYTEDGYDYDFTDQTSGAVSWDWSFGDGDSSFIQNPSHTYTGGESYSVTLQVTNSNGCVGSATQLIEIFQDLVVPNIITPNDDGTNDFFLIKTAGIKSFELIIVNRWGNTVFESNDPVVIWDGKTDGRPVEEGVYFYKLKASTSTKEYKYQGNVTVIRN